ncbi:multivesicular body subunit 12A-like [Sinocyclocheilus grahami]|uniref:multivesicular body subunit 12A-like n=1 Tax=Sinocyclocheilus grahami TaxID=75366 RepID=UPI0007AD0549|nr:PREDICTED: multivesicular body subunit 12A-like [Sinocyclocheilus grahami]
MLWAAVLVVYCVCLCFRDMNGFVVWCLKGQFSTPTPQAKPRSVSLDMRSLSLEGTGPPQPLKPSNPPEAPPKFSRRRSKLDTHNPMEAVYDSGNHSSIHGLTAMDGVPFSLHPKFESQSNSKVSVSTLSDIRIKSVQDIENEYNYTFAVEELAAKRMCPSVSG